MRIGPYALSNRLILAPMAGVTDRPFRQLCRELGAGMAVSEMVIANAALRDSRKTQSRINHSGERGPISVQIAGADPVMMAESARYNVEKGAQIIDINMGCPAKKVCNQQAGSALLRNIALVRRILEAVVEAVAVPVTLKIRTGWDPTCRNGVAVARLAESCGIQALAVHGRTRACGFTGTAEYDTIAAIKAALSIPVIANGDISHPQQAKDVLAYTGADAIMIGRAAQGQPWVFQRIHHFLEKGELLPPPKLGEIRHIVLKHLQQLYQFHGEQQGVRIARKHIAWYSRGLAAGASLRPVINAALSAEEQLACVQRSFDLQAKQTVLAA